jgi:alkaline phosphatase
LSHVGPPRAPTRAPTRAAAPVALATLLIAVLAAAAFGGTPPRNIILFIGDGMGASHVTAGRVAAGGLHLDRFRVAGHLATHPANDLVPDSAAAGTALATGYRTLNGVVSLSPSGRKLKTVAEHAEELGMATGIVATCSVTHATPASFFAHVESRGDHAGIAEHLAVSGVDVLLGGGWSYFAPRSDPESRREDELDLVSTLRERLPVVRSYEELVATADVDGVVGLFAPGHPPEAGARGYSLADLTAKSIEILSQDDDGFFLMVEGSQIDWAAHDHDTVGVIEEMLDFDGAVGVGLDFAQADGRTLVIVTADHETGGFAVRDGSVEERAVTDGGYAAEGHTASLVPIFAYGPMSDDFGGIHENTYVGETLISHVRRRGLEAQR